MSAIGHIIAKLMIVKMLLVIKMPKTVMILYTIGFHISRDDIVNYNTSLHSDNCVNILLIVKSWNNNKTKKYFLTFRK